MRPLGGGGNAGGQGPSFGRQSGLRPELSGEAILARLRKAGNVNLSETASRTVATFSSNAGLDGVMVSGHVTMGPGEGWKREELLRRMLGAVEILLGDTAG